MITFTVGNERYPRVNIGGSLDDWPIGTIILGKGVGLDFIRGFGNVTVIKSIVLFLV